MAEQDSPFTQSKAQSDPSGVAFSNAIRLTGRQWLFVGLFAALLVVFASPFWKQVEEFPLEVDYRIPHDLSNDYWLFERYAGLACAHYETVLLGDSVIWGEYVTRRQTLSHYLNELEGREACANLGLDGAHPLALCGLIEHYGNSIVGKNVIVQCNPLWLTTDRTDLQDEQAAEFNHPRLVSQFSPRIPSYLEAISPKLGIVVEQHLPLSSWAMHLQQAYYDRTDFPSWTLEHPYDNPLRPLARGLPPSDDTTGHISQPWFKRGIAAQDYPWIKLESSLQWHAFRRAVLLLRQRNNQVFVLVGPFNEHLLSPESRRRYQGVKATIAAWLEAEQIAHALPPPLLSAQYGDASHPLAPGYARLARRLLDESSFRPFLSP